MRIGVDAREIAGRATGVGRYVSGLLHQWSTSRDAKPHEFVLYAPSALSIGLDTRRFATREVTGTGGTYWEQVQLPAVIARDHLDVWFAPAYSMPLRLRIPAVLAIHDLSFVAHPEWFRLREGARRRLLTHRSSQKARAIVTISEFSRRELVERLGVPHDRIHVIPPGVDSPLTAAASGALRGNHVLYVGSIFNRRHVPDLIRAFATVARRSADVSLDIVGDNRSHPSENIPRVIAGEQIEQQAQWHRYVSDERLHELFSQARAFAFLSEYEGLGLPPLEALAAGVPPVVLDTEVARESCLEAALYVAPGDLPGIARALETALFNEHERTRILAHAPSVVARYNWPDAAARILRLLESVA